VTTRPVRSTIVSEPYYHLFVTPPTTVAVTVAPSAAELASRLRVSVWRVARRLRHASDPGVTPTLHAALHTVETHGPMTAGQLASHENVRKPTMTRTIHALVQQGLISRTTDPLDGRVTWLQITSAGTRLLERSRHRSTEYLARRLATLSQDDRDLLDRASDVLDRLAATEERS
jgi:DNA-binding MarR family transcriptional regulator